MRKWKHLAVGLAAPLLLLGCFSSNKQRAALTRLGTGPGSPGATIAISYAKPRDYLNLVTVTEYTGALLVARERRGADNAAIVRLDGGHTLWVIKAEKGMFPRLSIKSKFAISQVQYGTVPPHFVQVEPPAVEPPEALQPGRFYIFSVERGSGSVSHFMSKGQYDGRLVGYDAEPMAGDSFELCCDVAQNFVPEAIPVEMAQPPPDPATEPVPQPMTVPAQPAVVEAPQQPAVDPGQPPQAEMAQPAPEQAQPATDTSAQRVPEVVEQPQPPMQ